jgi:F0F1-type ATP synthase membrane subunit a
MYTEDTAGPGLWKSAIVGLAGVWLIAAAFVVPPGIAAVYNNWAVGFVATIAAISMSGNRRWERPIATALTIWLFISGFVPSVLSGRPLFINELGVGLVLVAAAVSANMHLRDDVRHGRRLAM